jgi:cation:H+ antiporter
LGRHFHVADAVIGAIVLAGVTSLPNAVAAIHLASKGRGAAALSTALNSNSINVIAGLLIPGLFVGLARSSVPGSVTAWWYVGLTLVTLVFAFLSRGLRRWQGGVLVLGYLAFVVVLVSAT